ncbi:MAG TPA: NADH-quinone oxidoreductase subunit J [Anaerolineae bacterium]|nr:NADH-quinone oxidoreductase subunit J [Anaerolineae bacterium]MCB0226780.1 NADH-quinone oxidoreductase subunit J [Anaerolineae bacterium]MCB9105443.1 NADH-quinone oxidoreductase subunit J [Anaerolineales bacterium]HRV96326.1 NADH-quinone oxidoreductase subunit J [Anaerolineae bacterium]
MPGQIFFLIVAAISVISALGVIFNRSVVHSALFLLVNFGTLAVFYFMLNAQFLGVAQILVYAGAIVVLFLFVEMLIGSDLGEKVDTWLNGRNLLLIALGLVLLTVVGTAVFENTIFGAAGNTTVEVVDEFGQTQVIAASLFTDFVLPFQLVAVLLSVGVVGVVWLAQHQQRQRFRRIIAVLDSTWAEETQRPGPDLLRVNWLRRKTLFDFDQVEIIQATDPQVAELVAMVEHDTDSWRRSRYRQMRCLVDPDCKLSEDTVQMLRHTFGEVKNLVNKGVVA